MTVEVCGTHRQEKRLVVDLAETGLMILMVWHLDFGSQERFNGW